MARRRLLLLLKPLDMYPSHLSNGRSLKNLSQVLRHLDNRRKVHKEAINFCQGVLKKKLVDWEPIFRNNISQQIRNVDLVVTVGGDGTLLQASHLMDDSVPVLGVNSDPTHVDEVEEFREHFDATRSTGFLCAATVNNFETVLDDILEGQMVPSELSRISLNINSKPLLTHVLNDILIAHPCPAAMSRFSLRIKTGDRLCSPVAHYRSSGLRVSTAAGSTAAMLSAGGFSMPISSPDLQYMVREPILPSGAKSHLRHGSVRAGESMDVTWFCREGVAFIDGCHVFHTIRHGDIVRVASDAPVLKVFLAQQLQCHSFKICFAERGEMKVL